MKKINEGFLARLTNEYVGNIERNENVIDGVEYNHSFTDMNGKLHKRGYKVIDGNVVILKELVSRLIEKRGDKANLNDIDVSNMKKLHSLFSRSNFNGDLSGWDVSNVSDFSYMFYMDIAFDNHSIDKWNVKKARNFDCMFEHAVGFNGDLSNWDVSNVRKMNEMFSDCGFNGDLSNWNVKNVEDFTSMFCESKFNNHSIDNWKLGKGKYICLTEMFRGVYKEKDCSNIDLSNWDVTWVTDAKNMFEKTNAFFDISKLNFKNLTHNKISVFKGCPIYDKLKNDFNI